MSEQAVLMETPPPGDEHNVTDWFLGEVHLRYQRSDISKDDVWAYLYGVMHAPDWRERYRHELSRRLPRVPLADDFEVFRDAGAELMVLHAGYESAPEHPGVVCEVDGERIEDPPDNGAADPAAFRIESRMRWGKDVDKSKDMTVLIVNKRCRLTGIPPEAHDYQVSGRSPLQWAVDQLKHKHDKASGITDDPNGWHAWAEEPFELIRHLRRLAFVGTETARIVASLPPSLPDDLCSGAEEPEAS